MRSGGGKAKGSAFERRTCKELSRWLSGGTHDDLFWRSAMSGGRSTVAFKVGKKLSAQAGDVSSIHRMGHALIDQFTIECKHYRTLNFECLIKGTGNLIKFWLTASRDAKKYNKMPMLIGKQNNYPTVVCLCSRGMMTFNIGEKVRVAEYDLNIVLWSDFLKVSPRLVKRVRL